MHKYINNYKDNIDLNSGVIKEGLELNSKLI